MSRETWRDRLAPLVEEVRLSKPGASPSEYALLFQKAYPLTMPSRGGPSYPYKIWRDEIRAQTGLKEELTPKGRCQHTIDMFLE